MVLTVEPRPHIKNQVDLQYCTQEVLPAINARLMCEKGVSRTSAALINSSSSPAATFPQNRTLNIAQLDNYHAQLGTGWHPPVDGWLDGRRQPAAANGGAGTRARARAHTSTRLWSTARRWILMSANCRTAAKTCRSWIILSSPHRHRR